MEEAREIVHDEIPRNMHAIPLEEVLLTVDDRGVENAGVPKQLPKDLHRSPRNQ